MTRPIGAAVSVLLVAAAVLAAQDQTIRRPANLPEPVGEDQRVQASDIDAALADPKVVLLDVREPWELEKFGTREGLYQHPAGRAGGSARRTAEGQDDPHGLKRRRTGCACRGLADRTRVHICWFLRTTRLHWRSRPSDGHAAVASGGGAHRLDQTLSSECNTLH